VPQSPCPSDTAAAPARVGGRRPGWLRVGPQDLEILRLAGPAFGALVAEPLFLLADSAIVGRIGTVLLGGLGVASQALTTLVNISIFPAYGTTAAGPRAAGPWTATPPESSTPGAHDTGGPARRPGRQTLSHVS
jgi:hypothetical protein